MLESAGTRLLIFVVVDTRASSVRWILDRLPASFLARYLCEVMLIGDGADGNVDGLAQGCREAYPAARITVLHDDMKGGYGDNQKLAFAYAMAEEFAYVAMLHCDGRHDPADLPRLMDALVDTQADAAFGNRMARGWGTGAGKMPFLNYLGNRILTGVENRFFGTRLSDAHTGYRVYAVSMLRDIPFHLNTDGFHFDTEVLIQLENAGARIIEVPVTTSYGAETRRVRGLSYAIEALRATVKNAFHRIGLLYQRRFDPLIRDNRHYSLKLGYPSSHSWALDGVPPGTRVLDIGSGPCSLARELLKKGCKPAAVDQFPPPDGDPRIPVFVQDLDDPLTFDVRPYDYLLLLDIIEHLKEPELFLERLRGQFEQSSKRLILTTPNVAFIVQRLMLLGGQFNYGKAGILDRTHKRLFTFRGTIHLLRDAGFRIERVRGVPAPFAKIVGRGWLARVLTEINAALIRVSKTLFAYQVYVEAQSTPDLDFRLRAARDAAPRPAAIDAPVVVDRAVSRSAERLAER